MLLHLDAPNALIDVMILQLVHLPPQSALCQLQVVYLLLLETTMAASMVGQLTARQHRMRLKGEEQDGCSMSTWKCMQKLWVRRDRSFQAAALLKRFCAVALPLLLSQRALVICMCSGLCAGNWILDPFIMNAFHNPPQQQTHTHTRAPCPLWKDCATIMLVTATR